MSILQTGCKSLPVSHQDNYSFFVAGHTYGSPSRKLPGLHPPFVTEFDTIKAFPNMSFGVLTGDIVYYSRDTFWDQVDQELNDFNLPTYFATGNHDEGHKAVYKNRYGRTFYTFEHGQDLFLVLNPGLGGWNIWNDQLSFLKSQLEHTTQYKHIFVFAHHVLWSDPLDKNSLLKPNSYDGRAPTINFWTEVMPLFYATQRPVYIFAGDVGANYRSTKFSLNHHQNVHFLASGMGNLQKDNYLLVEVNKNQGVSIFIRWIQGHKTERLNMDDNNDILIR